MATFLPIAKGFNNMRGSYKLGLIDLGTQSSLVQRRNGNYVLLDSLTMEPRVRNQVNELTDNGKKLEAILNVHPFHTMHCEWAHKEFPNAKLYGSSRHLSKFPNLPWERELVDMPEMHERFSEDFAFSVPKGVDFISSNENVHFSSVLAFHKDTKTMHVDDTFVYIPLPQVAAKVGVHEGAVALHPSLPLALQGHAGAAHEFREWVREIAAQWDVRNLCAAHSGTLLESDNTGDPIPARITKALQSSEPVLSGHEVLHGTAK